MPEKEYRVFLSSTAKGLSTAREKVASNFRRMTDIKLVRYEDFTASPVGGIEKCLNEVGRCDLFLLVCGPFLGSTYKGRSIVEIEHQAAIDAGIPCLVFLASSDFRIRCGDVEDDQSRVLLERFKQDLSKRYYREEFSDEIQLVQAIVTATSNWQLEQALPKGFQTICSHENIEVDAISSGSGTVDCLSNTRGELQIVAKGGPLYLRRVRVKENGVETDFSFLSNQLPRKTRFLRSSGANLMSPDNERLIHFQINEPRMTTAGLLLEPAAANFAPPIRDSIPLPLLTQPLGKQLIASVIGGSCKIQEYTMQDHRNTGKPFVFTFNQELEFDATEPLRIPINQACLHSFRFVTEEPIIHIQLEYGDAVTSPIRSRFLDDFSFTWTVRAPENLFRTP